MNIGPMISKRNRDLHTKKRTTCTKPATDLWQACWNKLVARFIRTACSQLVDKLLQACIADLLQA